ncbi:phosphopantetheine-binding protein [Embleya sp. NBC_00896]|uniref:phosphopantetheine-binding protein n=1 Tax=Embleya sp. NBC_00896 TaxID=2975961 RepID=UPI002F9100F9|nr:phosphopantetheine-binding protein [Embleya sp. NBC_00896]
MAELQSRLEAVIKETYPPAAVDLLLEGATFEAAGVDSLGVVELLLLLQREFGTAMDGDELTVHSTLTDTVDLLRSEAAGG